MVKISEYDVRQFNLMLKKIGYYQNNQSTLSELVQGLEALINVLEEINREWCIQFYKEWGVLESINAKVPKMTKEEIGNIIDEAVANLKKLVEQKLANQTDCPPPSELFN